VPLTVPGTSEPQRPPKACSEAPGLFLAVIDTAWRSAIRASMAGRAHNVVWSRALRVLRC
jgi:hypothetical protein